jgi:hypothetical protein
MAQSSSRDTGTGGEAADSIRRRDRWRRRRAVALGSLLLLVAAAPALAESRCVRAKPGGPELGDAIGLVVGEGPPGDRQAAAAVLVEALDFWRACPEFGRRFPAIDAGIVAGRTYVVRFAGYSAGTRCGYVRGNTIVVHAAARAGGQLVSCGRPARVLAHELGHVLGLADAPLDAGCDWGIMSAVDIHHRDRPRVLPGECRAVEGRWLVSAEGAR